MCKAIENMRNEAKWQKAAETAMILIAMGILTEEQIAHATGLTLEEVRELSKEVQTPV